MTLWEAQTVLAAHGMWLEHDLGKDGRDEWRVYQRAFGVLRERRQVSDCHWCWEFAFEEIQTQLAMTPPDAPGATGASPRQSSATQGAASGPGDAGEGQRGIPEETRHA